MAIVDQTNLGIVAQAVEQQLLTYLVQAGSAMPGSMTVVGDVSNIYWVRDGELPPPGITGQRDVLFRFHRMDRVNFQGDARFAMWHTGIDVFLRMSLVLDRVATKKDWSILEYNLVDGVNDALDGFFPQDADSDALTIEGFVPLADSEQAKRPDAATWGEQVASYHFHIVPNVNFAVL